MKHSRIDTKGSVPANVNLGTDYKSAVLPVVQQQQQQTRRDMDIIQRQQQEQQLQM